MPSFPTSRTCCFLSYAREGSEREGGREKNKRQTRFVQSKLGAVAQNWALGAMLKNALFGLLMLEIKLCPNLEIACLVCPMQQQPVLVLCQLNKTSTNHFLPLGWTSLVVTIPSFYFTLKSKTMSQYDLGKDVFPLYRLPPSQILQCMSLPSHKSQLIM